MKNIKRLFLPLTIFAALTLASCRADLATNYSKDDLDIDTDWEDFNIPPTGITFAQGEENLYIERGETHQYDYQVTPKGASAALLSWTSSNESIATISDEGLLTAVSGGHTQITIREENNAFAPVLLNVNVTVDIMSFNVVLNADPSNLDWNHEYTFETSFVPEDTTWRDLIWTIPEEEQNIATVDNGVLTTYQETGTVHLTITSPRLSGVSQTMELNIADRKIHVNSIALALESGEPNRIEIGEHTTAKATINPNDAQDASELKYYSRNPNIATVDPVTGVVTALEPGTAHIFANCEGVDSNDLEIEVYEVYATSIAFAESSDVIVTNESEGSKQLHVNIGVSELGKDAPSRAVPTYSVKYEDRDIVSVSETGVVSALKSGVATVNVSIAGQGDNVYEDSIQVTSKAYVNQINISGPISAYLDETATLIATVSPDAVEDENVSWSVNPSEKVTTEINGNTIVITPLEEGPVTVTATSEHLHTTASHTISFNERKVEFEYGEVYLVGDKQFNTGESIVGQASWVNAKYALKLGPSSSDDSTVSRQLSTSVTLHAGDQFKLREGPDATGWKDMFYYSDDGVKVWNYEQAGAIDNVHLKASNDKSGNIEVLKDAKYDIYYKDLTTGEFRVYIGLAPVIHFDKESLSIGHNSTSTIYLHNYEGTPTVTSSDENIVKILNETTTTDHGYAVEFTGWGVGTATITATDSAGHTATSHITVRSDSGGVMTPIYLNANGIFDSDGAIPFIHAYGDETNHSDLQMTLVDGQSMIYVAEISDVYENTIFVRMPSGSTALDWETAWNQSRSEDATYGDNNMFTITGFDATDGKYLTGTWGVFDPEIIYSLPADYTLVGSFNNWTVGDQDYALSKVTSGHYCITDVELTQGDAIKVVDKTGEHWYANANTYDNCGYTLVNDGYGGFNISLNESGTYTIDFYEVDEYGTDNHIVFTKQGGEGGGDDPIDPPTPTVSYYVKGTFNDWAQDENLKMSLDAENANHYYINHVELESGDKLKINNPALGDDGWYGVHHAYDNCGFTVDEEGNLVVSKTSTYSINLYLNSDDGNYITLWDEEGGGDDPIDPPEPSTIKTFYFTNNYGWDSLKAYVWNNSTQAKPADWPGLAMTYVYTNDMGQAVYSIDIDTALYDYVIFNSGSVQTVDIALSSFGSNNACYISGGSGNAHTVGYWNYQ